MQSGLCTAPAVVMHEAKQRCVKAWGWGRTQPQLEEPPQGSSKQLGLGVTWETKLVPYTEHLLEVTARKVLGNHHSKIVKNQYSHIRNLYTHRIHPDLFSSIHPSPVMLKNCSRSSGGCFKGCLGHGSIASCLPAASICLCSYPH